MGDDKLFSFVVIMHILLAIGFTKYQFLVIEVGRQVGSPGGKPAGLVVV